MTQAQSHSPNEISIFLRNSEDNSGVWNPRFAEGGRVKQSQTSFSGGTESVSDATCPGLTGLWGPGTRPWGHNLECKRFPLWALSLLKLKPLAWGRNLWALEGDPMEEYKQILFRHQKQFHWVQAMSGSVWPVLYQRTWDLQHCFPVVFPGTWRGDSSQQGLWS